MFPVSKANCFSEKIPYFRATAVDMANLATKPSSRDDGLMARLSSSTNMLHELDGPRVRLPGAVRFEMLIDS